MRQYIRVLAFPVFFFMSLLHRLYTALPAPGATTNLFGNLVRDPRHFQILTLGSLLTLIILWSDFGPTVHIFLITVLTTLLTQYALTKLYDLPRFDFRSPLISALSLSILLKAASIYIFPLAAFLAISSKFTLRVNDKHIFNPANFASVISLMMMPDHVWVSPGQWGSTVWLGFALICLGVMVLSSARRGDMAIFFLGSWAALIFGRAVWLGDPFAIPIHNIQSGALLIFAFFMISDPKTTPNHRVGRLIFAFITAAIGFSLQYGLQVREGIFYALFITCLFTPMIDSLLKDYKYQWGKI